MTLTRKEIRVHFRDSRMSDQSMSQEEIDAMLAGLSDEPAAVSPKTGPPAESPPKPPKPAAPPAPMMVDQDELDRLMDDLQAGGASEVESAVAAAAAAAPSGPLGQNDIDAILAALNSPAPEVVQAPAEGTSDSPLGQGDIDALLASMAGESAAAPKEVSKPATAPVNNPQPSGDDPLGQGDIDALLRSLETASAPEVMPEAPVAAVVKEMPAGKLGQDDIDSLLNNLGAEQISVGAKKIGEASKSGLSKTSLSKISLSKTSLSKVSRGSLALTSEDLTALVSKHAAPAPAGGEAEGMIDQEDIDALVKQLGAVNGPGDPAPGGKPSMTEELAKHDAAIDELLGGQKPSANAVTMDAIDVRGMDRPPSTSNNGRPNSGPTFTIPVLTPPELRGARWLLAAAVLLLGVCAGTLVVVASALRTLGGELAHERLAALEPGEDYGDDYKAAVARLTAPDEQEAAKGVLFLQRLKKRYPSHEAEVALVLARHFRRLGAWQEADREYASLPDDLIDDDPRVTLERADTLRQLHEIESARRQLYNLLANEARHLAPTTPPRPTDITERNRRTLIEAHLMLGRLLDATNEPTVASADADEHAEAHAGQHPEAHAPAAVTDEAGHAATHDSEGHH